ncbi:MAG: EpsI family protein [Gammaproteobacteria bacterium]|uniref:EpsI family protein n=1 Tax=Candidatus Kutchimonas denitrificans TaxID=3056748 RepID=A0AAE4Z8D4_9BACT|nr:EpsI family protein [Gemmatimonadota bacterium]NIR75154.1 EpsI family protein [Candidatus Kutchimonas denitrificans]NIU52964.1 EpsI family protein [Gemmatimonadota bacterium]NIV52433.1 EpsI family protein [Gammaproteobacteria bacterium]NIY44853.1 EpsI family protein [Gemmatimonadota bacterium]
MKKRLLAWTPATLMGVVSVFTLGIDLQRELPLREPLDNSLPRTINGFTGSEQRLSEEQALAAGMTDYVMLSYRDASSDRNDTFSLYVAYYAQQSLGHTIHSPKNCLPGTGWQALASRTEKIVGPGGNVAVNRYIVQREDQRALVLYWYQGRGRVEANEYRVKWHLLRDSALRRRSDEALVRVVVPIVNGEEAAWKLARDVVGVILPAVDAALPAN